LNPLATELNQIIKSENPHVYSILSELGTELYYPRGILTQTAEAKAKAKKHDATIGIAKEGASPMYLSCIMQSLSGLNAEDVFPYAPTTGKPELRNLWAQEMVRKNPSLKGKKTSLPIVTSGLTHGLSLAADLFIDPGDVVILPDKIWGNYKMMLGTRNKAVFRQYTFFNGDRGFNTQGFSEVLKETAAERSKIILVLNFPNNPTGYSLTEKEASSVRDTLIDVAESDCNLVVIIDDAYFGLFYDQEVMKESLFGYVAGSHPRILAVKLDGATKEDYVWGFRVGFITFGLAGDGDKDKIYEALEKKAGGGIRASISNCAHISQSIILQAMRSPDYAAQKKEKFEVMQARARKVREVLSDSKYEAAWEPHPFNSGYFMCLRLKNVDAERLRKHLLDHYGIGTITLDEQDVRIAFSCLEVEDIQDLFDTMLQAVQDLGK
jgi:aspartate/methionine/tyrosine aminotransferase